MNIEISASETFPTQADRDDIRRQLEYALRDYAAHIAQVQVWMVGIVRGDEDEAQYCLINVKLADGSLVACDGTDALLRTAISRAAERVSWEVARNLGDSLGKASERIDASSPLYRASAPVGQASTSA